MRTYKLDLVPPCEMCHKPATVTVEGINLCPDHHIHRPEDWWTCHDGVTRCVGCHLVKCFT